LMLSQNLMASQKLEKRLFAGRVKF
jgi:hypothetical protein